MRTVPLNIHRVVLIVVKVPTTHVINKTISVIIDSITRNFIRINPYVRRQVGVIVVHPGINHCNFYCARSRCFIPSLGGIDIGISETEILTGIMHAPQPVKIVVVR